MLAMSFTVWFWTSSLNFLCLHTLNCKMRINYMTYFKKLPQRWNVKANLYCKNIRTSSENFKEKYFHSSIIHFQHIQSSKHCKAYTDEEDPVLLLESFKFCSKEMTMLQDERTSWQESGHGCAEKTDITWARSLKEMGRTGGGNGKDRRRRDVPGRGRYLIKCTEKASAST